MGIRDLPGSKTNNLDSFAYSQYIMRYILQKVYRIQAYYLRANIFKRGSL